MFLMLQLFKVELQKYKKAINCAYDATYKFYFICQI